jgi:hypothetical protein
MNSSLSFSVGTSLRIARQSKWDKTWNVRATRAIEAENSASSFMLEHHRDDYSRPGKWDTKWNVCPCKKTNTAA